MQFRLVWSRPLKAEASAWLRFSFSLYVVSIEISPNEIKEFSCQKKQKNKMANKHAGSF